MFRFGNINSILVAMNMFDRWNRYYGDERYAAYMDVGLFVVLLFGFHFIFLGWQHWSYYPIGDAVAAFQDSSSALLYRQADWCLSNVFNMQYELDLPNQGFVSHDKSGGRLLLAVAPICSSLKQWCHWLFLMFLFPGPWRHKAWYIPAGLVVIELVNVVRVVGIFLSMYFFPGSFEVAHNYVFKFFFYFVIFLMWVLWVEKFAHKKVE